MQNLIPLKNNLRLSRFSQNFNADFLKNFQSFNSKDNLENTSSNQTDSFITTKKSIFLDQKRTSKNFRDFQDSIRQNRQQDIFAKQISIKKTKFYEIDQLKKYRQTLFQLPFLQEKPKKIKFKHICLQFVEFFFQIMKNPQFIQKIFSSFVSHQAILNEFARMIQGFQLKKYHPGRTIEIGKDQEYFFIFVEGITQNATVKTTSRLSRKSFCESLSSSTSLVRRSGLKTKTITSKGKIACFEGNLPMLINQKQFNFCTLKTSCECTFLLLEKNIWNKFLIQLQKLEEKQLVVFIKQWTTINLNISTLNDSTKKDNSVERKTFLYDAKHPKLNDQDSQSQNIVSDKVINNQRKVTVHGISSTYKIFNLVKDQKMKVDNQNVYLIIKGSAYLTSKCYSIIINQGSIINTSILLNIQPETVQIKSLTDCLIVKLILDQIYFKKQDQNQFIQKIQQIQSFRNHINKVSLSNIHQNQIENSFPANNFNSDQMLNISQPKSQNSPLKIDNERFQPPQIRVQDLNIEKGSQKKIKKFRDPRICHHNQIIKTQPCQDELIKNVAFKFANNYCIYEKIVQSKQKVSQSFKLNSVSKIFPIKDLLQNKQFRKNLDLFTQNSRKSTLRQDTFIDFIEKQKKDSEQMNSAKSSSSAPYKMNQQSLKKKRESHTSLKSLKKRRQQFQKILLERKKKQKSKIIENLFYINLKDNKKNQKANNKNQNLRFSAETHPDRVSEMIRRNSQCRFSQIQSQNISYDFFKENNKDKERNDIKTSKTSRGKFSANFLVTEPNSNEMKRIQKIISGQNQLNQTWSSNGVKNTQIGDLLQNQNCISSEFLKMKKMTTRKIKATMFNGRIRKSTAKA